MKILLLDGTEKIENSSNNYSKIIEEKFQKREDEIEIVILRDKNINSCIGCFNCWVKNPGICVIKDDAQNLAEKLINSDLIIYLTPITFGGYSFQLKKALDRMLPLISPFFQKINGEIHHKGRYKKYPMILGIGVTDSIANNESKIFRKLVERNGINFHSKNDNSIIIMKKENKEEIENKINNFINKVGV